MSYKQAMGWASKHPKGTRQPVLMHTNSGFWPSRAFLEEKFWPYLEECKAKGVEPMKCKDFYDSLLR